MTLLPSPHDGNADAAAEVVRERCALVPSVAIVLGSGLGAATAAMQRRSSRGRSRVQMTTLSVGSAPMRASLPSGTSAGPQDPRRCVTPPVTLRGIVVIVRTSQSKS